MKLNRKRLPPGPVPERIQARWSHLCQHIGERRAGGAGERAAAEYILDQFRQTHLDTVHAEPFPCTAVGETRAEIALGLAARWKPSRNNSSAKIKNVPRCGPQFSALKRLSVLDDEHGFVVNAVGFANLLQMMVLLYGII